MISNVEVDTKHLLSVASTACTFGDMQLNMRSFV